MLFVDGLLPECGGKNRNKNQEKITLMEVDLYDSKGILKEVCAGIIISAGYSGVGQII